MTGTCKACGKKFISPYKKQIYCSKSCYYTTLCEREAKKRAGGKNGVNTTPKDMVRVICGEDYTTTYGRKTCSTQCHLEHQRNKSRANAASRRLPDHKYRNTKLVKSKCPLCERTYMGLTSRNFCPQCKLSVKAGHIPDQYDGGRVFSNRPHGACA